MIFLSTYAQKLEFEYFITEPEIVDIETYQTLVLPNSKQMSKVGDPSLPYISTKLLLPPGKISTDVKYVFENKVKLNGTFNLYPKQNVQPLSVGNSDGFVINQQTYSQTKYPDISYTSSSTQFMNGYGFAFSNFTPIEYNPSTGEAYYYKNVKVIIEYIDNTNKSSILKNLTSRNNVINRVSNMADNPNAVNLYPIKRSTNNYDMLIITSNDYSDNFDDLINFHLYRGNDVRIVTLSEIENEMSGYDLPEKMRNYIIQEYQNYDIQYVLLGGDAEIVPYRGFYCGVQSSSYYEDENIPADVYFSSLDGTWNDDGDNLWGEPGEDDLLPEIAVGRLPFSNYTELASIINKIISYSNNPVVSTNELSHPLLAGEHLWDDPLTWGADYLDLLVGYHEDNGYTTNGIPETSSYSTMYQRDGNNWGGSDIMSSMNDGYSFLHHVGHASSGYMMGLYTSDITNSNFSSLDGVTHNYALVYSHGCICGAFDDNDCISERMVTIDNCAVAAFTNSRYGWFNEGQTEGPSQHLHREFVDALYTDGHYQAGIAEMVSKYETAPWVNNPDEHEPGAQRWVFYDHNVMTDPALPIWTTNPMDFSVSYDYILPFGAEYIVDVASAKGPLENYTCVVIQNETIVGKGYTNESGQALINVNFDEAVIGEAILVVSGANVLPQQYDILIAEATGVVLSMFSVEYSDDNNNQPDYNETLNLELVIKNYGQQNASNVTLTLASDDENVVVINSIDDLGNIAATDSVISTNLQIATDFVDDQYTTELNLNIVSDEYASTRTISLIINAPEINYNSITITEIAGDGDGIVEPGETGNLLFDFTNNGHAVTPDITGLLSSSDNNIVINTESQIIGQIAENNSFTISSDFDINSSAQIGDVIQISCAAQANPYSKFVEAAFYLGDATEDFETGDFTKFDWQFDGNLDWEINSDYVNQGTYSAVSGEITDNQTSVLKIDLEILNDGEISFFKKVSSEENWDYFRFFIDGELQNEWSGEVAWSQETYNVSAGQHTFEWIYDKDVSVSDGDDCAWVDDIVFPPFGAANIVTNNQNIITYNDFNLTVYPVPFSTSVNFKFESSSNQEYKIEIYDLSGRNIFRENSTAKKGENIFIWNAPLNLENGVYFYRIFIDSKMLTGKILNQ